MVNLSECDINIHLKTKDGEYGPVEDGHLILNLRFSSLVPIQTEIEKSREISVINPYKTDEGSFMKKKRALVTGASRGIGFEIAKVFSNNGIEVCGTRSKNAGKIMLFQNG